MYYTGFSGNLRVDSHYTLFNSQTNFLPLKQLELEQRLLGLEMAGLVAVETAR